MGSELEQCVWSMAHWIQGSRMVSTLHGWFREVPLSFPFGFNLTSDCFYHPFVYLCLLSIKWNLMETNLIQRLKIRQNCTSKNQQHCDVKMTLRPLIDMSHDSMVTAVSFFANLHDRRRHDRFCNRLDRRSQPVRAIVGPGRSVCQAWARLA